MHTDTPQTANDTCVMKGRVEEFFIKGASIQYRVIVEGMSGPMIVDVLGTAIPPASVAQQVWLSFARSDLFLLGED
jgi:hypothetical protein